MTTVAKTIHNATLIEPAPLEVVSTLAAAGVDVADIRICVCTDLAADGLHYGDQRLVVVEDRVLVVRQQPAGWAVIDTAIADVVHAHTEALVGGGRLLIERHDEPTLSVAFTSTEAAKFSEVSRMYPQVVDDEEDHRIHLTVEVEGGHPRCCLHRHHPGGVGPPHWSPVISSMTSWSLSPITQHPSTKESGCWVFSF